MVVAGRAVDVDLALGQEAVRSLAVQKAGERGPKDRRNMYLVRARGLHSFGRKEGGGGVEGVEG